MQKTGSNKISFHYQSGQFSFKNRTRLKSFLIKLFQSEGYKVGHVSYVFCTDDYLLKINQSHLDHDSFTDIISFDLSEPGAPITSEIYISIDRVRENAPIFETSFYHELCRVMIHGALHLCGYKDKSRQEKQRMRRMEEKYLDKFFN